MKKKRKKEAVQSREQYDVRSSPARLQGKEKPLRLCLRIETDTTKQTGRSAPGRAASAGMPSSFSNTESRAVSGVDSGARSAVRSAPARSP